MTENNNGASVEPSGGEAFSGHSLHVSHLSKMPQIFGNMDTNTARMRLPCILLNYIWECGTKDRTLREHPVSFSRTEWLWHQICDTRKFNIKSLEYETFQKVIHLYVSHTHTHTCVRFKVYRTSNYKAETQLVFMLWEGSVSQWK